jgi:hypothetical protein
MAYRKRADAWTESDTIKASKLMLDGADDATFVREVGRTRAAAQARLRYVNDPDLYKSTRKRLGRKSLGLGNTVGNLYVPNEVREEAERRRNEERSITATFFGDPGFHRSALGKKMAEASN